MPEDLKPPPGGCVGIGAGRIPEEPDPKEPIVEGIGTGLVPNCLGEMFPIGIVTSVPY